MCYVLHSGVGSCPVFLVNQFRHPAHPSLYTDLRLELLSILSQACKLGLCLEAAAYDRIAFILPALGV